MPEIGAPGKEPVKKNVGADAYRVVALVRRLVRRLTSRRKLVFLKRIETRYLVSYKGNLMNAAPNSQGGFA